MEYDFLEIDNINSEEASKAFLAKKRKKERLEYHEDKSTFLRAGLIPDIEKAISPTYWRLIDICYPMVLCNDYGEVGIDIYGTDIKSCRNDVTYFRMHYDYRFEAWRRAEKNQNGDLKAHNTLDEKLKQKFQTWTEILELEQRINRVINEENTWPPISGKFPQRFLKAMERVGDKIGWRFVTMPRGVEAIHFFESSSASYPDAKYRIPILAPKFSLIKAEIQSLYDGLRTEEYMETQVKGCLIEKYGKVDLNSSETRKIRTQLRQITDDVATLLFEIDMLGVVELLDEKEE